MPTFTMRMTDEEYVSLQAGAFMHGTSMAEYARSAIVKELIRETDSGAVQKRLVEERKKMLAARDQLANLKTTRRSRTATPAGANGRQAPAATPRKTRTATQGKP